ncbi:hypothetical protein K430107D3_12020 [Dysosmobacter welbionis]
MIKAGTENTTGEIFHACFFHNQFTRTTVYSGSFCTYLWQELGYGSVCMSAPTATSTTVEKA